MTHHVLDWCHCDTFLLSNLAQVLEAHTINILMTDTLEGGWIRLEHLASSNVDQSWTTLRHKNGVPTRAFVSFNRLTTFL